MSLENEVKILSDNSVYRVTDLIHQRGVRWEKDRAEILSNPKFKDTIMFDYLMEKEKEWDYALLKSLIEKHTKKYNYPIPEENELVVHLRMGDVVGEGDCCPGFEAINNMYKGFWDNLNADQFDKVTFVVALHFGANDLTGQYYYSDKVKDDNFTILENIKKQTEDVGKEMNIYSSSEPDKDICYMTHARHYMKSMSELSTIVSKCMINDSDVYVIKSYK